MIIINSIVKAFEAYQQYAERAAALKELRRLSVHQLADIGIEPYQLTQGVSAYPWREQQIKEPVVSAPVLTEKADNVSDTGFDFGRYIATMYSSQNRTGYMV